MSQRIEGPADNHGNTTDGAALAQLPATFVAPLESADADERWGSGPSLPNDHAAWMRDALSVSQRARTLLAGIKPAALRVVAYWEHRVKSIVVGGRTLSIDPSGCYRVG